MTFVAWLEIYFFLALAAAVQGGEGILLSCVQQRSDFLLNLLLCMRKEENAVVVF